MAWIDIFSSSNFWTALSGFGGTILGGYITWKIQRTSEIKRQQDTNLMAFRYHATMVEKIHHAAVYLKPAFVIHDRNPSQYLKIPKQFTVLPKFQDRDITTDLHFLSNDKHADLLASLENYRQHFEMLTLSFELRNKLFQDLLDVTVPYYQRGQKLTLEEVKQLIGPKVNGDLMAMTEITVNHINYLIGAYPQLRELIVSTSQKLFPGENFLALASSDSTKSRTTSSATG